MPTDTFGETWCKHAKKYLILGELNDPATCHSLRLSSAFYVRFLWCLLFNQKVSLWLMRRGYIALKMCHCLSMGCEEVQNSCIREYWRKSNNAGWTIAFALNNRKSCGEFHFFFIGLRREHILELGRWTQTVNFSGGFSMYPQKLLSQSQENILSLNRRERYANKN